MSIREKRISFKELLEKEKGIIAPCVFDSASARVAYMAGFKALCLSGAELSMMGFRILAFSVCRSWSGSSAVLRRIARCRLSWMPKTDLADHRMYTVRVSVWLPQVLRRF